MNPPEALAIGAPELAPAVDADPRAALARAVAKLRALQHPDGWWKAELETNVTMDAEDMLLREFLGVREPDATARAADWIRSH